jgi:CubicO group peptidase (beta-lactamase class C family)
MFGGYRRVGTPLPITAAGAAAGMCSSAEDLGRWTAALHGGKLLRASSYTAMTTPASGGASGYGLGMVIGSFRGHRTFFHPGGTSSGARSLVAYFPDDSLAVVVLVNAEPVDLDRVEAAITGAWYGAPPPIAPL